MPHATQRELAQRLGLTQAAVSMALRGSPGVSDETRERVLALARQLGYRSDPALAALSRRRWTGAHATIAFVGAPGDVSDAYLPSVARRCEELGLELWSVPAKALGDDDEVQRQLDSRRIAGVILGQTMRGKPRRLAWDRLRAVHCGLLVPPETGDVVCPDLPSAAFTAWAKVAEKGYRRVVAIMYVDNERWHSSQLLAGALLALERSVNDRRRFKVWIADHRRIHEAAPWVRSQRPEAVLGYYSSIIDHLAEGGVHLPFAALAADHKRPEVAGPRLDPEPIAHAAVDLLVSRLHDPPGAPPQRRMHLLEMPWLDGPSLPPRGEPPRRPLKAPT